MLTLLLRTRFQYYRNYIRYNFDRTTKAEIAVIVLIFMLLVLRSPADIGYNFNWFFRDNFSAAWATYFSRMLVFFYIVSLSLAFYTLRGSSEWQIIGSMPFSRQSIVNYFLIRHISKVILFIFILTIPFLLAFKSHFAIRVIRYASATAGVMVIFLLSFVQAFWLRKSSPHRKFKRLLLISLNIVIIASFVPVAPTITFMLSSNTINVLILLVISLIATGVLLRSIYQSFTFLAKETTTHDRKLDARHFYRLRIRISGNTRQALTRRDLLLLQRQKKSSFLLPIISSTIMIIISLFEESIQAIFPALIMLECLYCLILTRTILHLFELDATHFELLRPLPVKAKDFWWARWVFTFGIIISAMIIPVALTLTRFGWGIYPLLLFLISLIVIPSIFSTLICNAGFGTFPHVNFGGYLVFISIIMMVLFWFFMPFGTIILLGVMILWIRKSQRHLQRLELL